MYARIVNPATGKKWLVLTSNNAVQDWGSVPYFHGTVHLRIIKFHNQFRVSKPDARTPQVATTGSAG